MQQLETERVYNFRHVAGSFSFCYFLLLAQLAALSESFRCKAFYAFDVVVALCYFFLRECKVSAVVVGFSSASAEWVVYFRFDKQTSTLCVIMEAQLAATTTATTAATTATATVTAASASKRASNTLQWQQSAADMHTHASTCMYCMHASSATLWLTSAKLAIKS